MKQFGSKSTVSSNTAILRQAFIGHVHELIKLGYERLNPIDYQSAEEEVITGELADAIEDVLDDPPKEIDPWADHFSISEEKRVRDSKRKGKHRQRVDFRVQSGESRPRQRFQVEAKRMDGTHPVSIYLGSGGLGCFLSGEYSREENDAGMLGYVQAPDSNQWAKKLAEALTDAACNCVETPPWKKVNLVAGLDFTFRSKHDRPTIGRQIDIYHALLRFH